MNVSPRTALMPFTVLPFENQSILKGLTSKTEFTQTAATLAFGAAGGTLADIVEGLNMVADGDVAKGIARASPNMIKNLINAHQLATEGATQRDGDIALTPEEFSMWSLAQQAIGTAPMKVQEMYQKQSQLTEMTTHFKTQVSKLKRDYIEADSGNERMVIQKKWRDMGSSMRKVGLKPPAMIDLIRAPMEKRKRERQMVDGVSTTQSTRRAIEQMQ